MTRGGERHVVANMAGISIGAVVDMSPFQLLQECMFVTMQEK